MHQTNGPILFVNTINNTPVILIKCPLGATAVSLVYFEINKYYSKTPVWRSISPNIWTAQSPRVTVRKLLTTGTEDRWCPISLYILRFQTEVGMDGLTAALICPKVIVVTTLFKAKLPPFLPHDLFLMLNCERTHLPSLNLDIEPCAPVTRWLYLLLVERQDNSLFQSEVFIPAITTVCHCADVPSKNPSQPTTPQALSHWA